MRSFGKMVESYMKYGKASLSEEAPGGWEGTVKAMKGKKDIDNPYALSHWMKNQGYKSHKSVGNKSKGKKEQTEDLCSACEGIRIWHPIHGRGTITEVSNNSMKVNWDNLEKRIKSPVINGADVALLERIREEYTSDPGDLSFDFDDLPDVERETTSNKKNKIGTEDDEDKEEDDEDSEELTESMIAMGMSGIQGTYRGTSVKKDDLGFLTMDDLLEDEDGYTGVPRPADSVLAQQDVKKPESSNSKPLSTLAGYEKAHNKQEPDGDYNDIMPDDAPDIPEYKELDDTSGRRNTKRRNTKKTGEGNHTEKADSEPNDYKSETKPESQNKEEKQMGNESFKLTARDLGLLMEGQHGTGVSGYSEEYGDKDVTETHDPSSGEVAMTRELLDKLLYSVSMQSPDEEKLEYICSGIEAASQEKGETLDVEDIETITQHIKDSYAGESSPSVDTSPDDEMEGGDYDDTEREADEGCGDYAREEDDDYYDEEDRAEGDDYYDEEDRAEGDGETAGPEGGPEHEGKKQLMDRKGDKGKDRDYDYENKKQRDMNRQKARSSKKKMRYGESEGGKSGTPVGYGNKKSGPGGGSTDEYGQKPSEEGGSNLLPAYPDGSKRGTPQGPWARGKPASKGKQKPLATESRKRRSSAKKKLDEAVMLGMASIPGTVRSSHERPDLAVDDNDDDAELKMIKRRSGIADWWKN